ncbi:MAG: hypothetical protein GX284_15450 [Clostridiales bacterium]|uniref:hypothetical protein n=1 Tax=Roseburia sp. MSJ-14 TaxID=2841514 RepID=UPI0016A00599|nr:hypothetical protein [Roseburia sp. MSJ-14]MBU5474503.1 hypothetical protein [Roseburia sp. MSJ-14]NLK79067.1 hypothetical protein [Clostridiales bacterium]
MSKEIKINIEALEEALENLRNASATFETYSTEFIGKARNCMDGFQSDFTEEMSWLLKNMSDTEAPQLLENIEEFINETEILKQGFQDADNGIAEQFK